MSLLPFIHADFLLETDVARELFHDVAEKLPIIDYHCHLSPALVADNHRFATMTTIWLAGDHYKWRAMRANGVPESHVTGTASDWEKFLAWARTVPYTLRNPLYHWTHMELRRPFGIDDALLDDTTAKRVYDRCNALLKEDGFTAQGLLSTFNVEIVCTTDDPTDTLDHHARHARSGAGATRMLPAFRADRALGIEEPEPFGRWLDALEAASSTSIGTYADLVLALDRRHAFFHEQGCRLSDSGLETIDAENYDDAKVAATFAAARAKRQVSSEQAHQYRSALLFDLAVMNHARGWTQQFHLGPLRNTNTRMLEQAGPDTGYDSIGDREMARPLARFLDRLDRGRHLAKTILYNLNPKDSEVLATMVGNYQDGLTPGKMQYGAAWWFLDQLDGMEKQLNVLSNMGLLSLFVGMLTDSRSFVSYSRHEYFRRLFCNMLGNDVKRGLLPDDRKLLARLVTDVCYGNAKRYFAFDAVATSRR
jgi:glucuronate isomerase